MVTLRQLFLPFTSPLNPQDPTAQQRQTLEKARGISASVHSCEQMEEAAKANPSPRPLDPGEVRLARRQSARVPAIVADHAARPGHPAAGVRRWDHRAGGLLAGGEEFGHGERAGAAGADCRASAPNSRRGNCSRRCGGRRRSSCARVAPERPALGCRRLAAGDWAADGWAANA